MNNKIIIGVILAVVVIGGAILLSSNSGENQTASETDKAESMKKETVSESVMEQKDKMMEKENPATHDSAMEKDDAMMKKDTMMEKENPEQPKPSDTMVKSGSYKDYSTATVESEQKAGNKVVLFFHASWCPTCKAANTAFLNKTSEIPAGVTVLKTDYDSNTELKKKYGVTYQHTFVQIDQNGNQVTKWNGGDLEALKKNLK